MSQWVEGEEVILVSVEETQRGQAALELLKELAEDRHKLGLDMAEEGWTGYGHTGTLRTCADRLCMAAADLLGRQQ